MSSTTPPTPDKPVAEDPQPQSNVATNIPTSSATTPASDKLPKPSKKPLFIAIAIVFGIPTLYVLYQLVVGIYYSRDRFYQQDQKKVEVKSQSISDEAEAKLTSINDKLIQLAPEIPADTLQTNGKRAVTNANGQRVLEDITSMPSFQLELKGQLTPIEPKLVQNLCEAFTRFDGNKFNSRPVSQRMSCWYGLVKQYYWTGSTDKLDELINKAGLTRTDVVIDGVNPGLDSSSIGQLRTKVLINDYYGNVNQKNSKPDWQKIYRDDISDKLKKYSEKDKRAILTVYLISEYYLFFDRAL